MTSFWDRYRERRERAEAKARETYSAQLAAWGWHDMRLRGYVRTYRNGYLGGLLRPSPLDRRGGKHGMIYADGTDDVVERREQADLDQQTRDAMEKPERKADDNSDEVKTVAGLAAYVAQAWDTGGSIYCATKTWFGSALSDALKQLAAQEKLSAAECRMTEADMLATMPPCRNCGCRPAKRAA
jgi:hypothetical protein